jgi:hypothetical protein
LQFRFSVMTGAPRKHDVHCWNPEAYKKRRRPKALMRGVPKTSEEHSGTTRDRT